MVPVRLDGSPLAGVMCSLLLVSAGSGVGGVGLVSLRFVVGLPGILLVGLKGFRVLEQKDSLGHLRGSAPRLSLSGMDGRHGHDGVHGLGEGVLEEGQVCPSKYASIVGVQLYVNNLWMVGACDGDCGGESYFVGCGDSGQHCICLGVG